MRTHAGPPPLSLRLSASSEGARRIRVEFLSPTQLKYEDRIAGRPEFPILFWRIRDRISTLSRLYGAGPLDIDYQGMGRRAASVSMTRCDLRWHGIERRSSRTAQKHPIGGFTGCAEYEGDFREFLPWLRAAKWAGVGRQSVWAKSEIETEALA